MAKTVIEIIEVNSCFHKIDEVEIKEIFCGFNDAKEKTVFSGKIEDIPDCIKDLKYTSAICDNNKIIVKYTNHKSFEGRKIQQQLQVPIQCNTQYL